MKLYVMRHGQTEWNVLKKIQGHTDIELNETGISQAQKAKDKLLVVDREVYNHYKNIYFNIIWLKINN